MKNFAYWKDVDNVPNVNYKIYSGTTTVNSAVITNGGAEVSWNYTSVSAGNGYAIFENTGPVGGSGSTLVVTACVPSDAVMTTINPTAVDGDPPRLTPSSTGVDCT